MLLSLAFYQCEEEPTSVITDPSQIALLDSTYVSSSTINPVQKKVLMEEFSGVKCSNCPAGNAKTHEIYNANSGNVIVVTVHSNFLASPYPGSPDLRNPDAQALSLAPLGPVPIKPSTYINRIKYAAFTNRAVIDIDEWENLVNAELALTSPIDINLETVYVKANERKFRYRVTLKFAEAMQDISLGFLLNESEIIAEQLDGSTHIEDYEHEFVLRDFITAIIGENISTTIEANTVIIKEFEIDLNEAEYNEEGDWEIENMHLVAFIRAANDEILQSAEVAL